jgi:hypothetical protein
MTHKVWCALVAVVALPFAFDATTGCTYNEPMIGATANSYQCSCDCEPAQRHRDLRVSFAEDDAEQRLDTTILLDSPDLDFLNGRFVGLRLRDVDIPPAAGILHAEVQFTVAPGSTPGALTVQIAGEAADNAPPFSTAPGSLGALPTTSNSVPWNPPDWAVVGEAGPDQLTPDLAAVLQEIVNRPGWMQGNALALVIKGTAGAALRKAFAYDGQPAAAAVLSVDYTDPLPNFVGPQNLPICVPAAFNEDLGGTAPTDADLLNDCTGRVQTTLSGLARACKYPSLCTCSVIADSGRFSGTCDAPCTEVPLDPSCSNFDPKHGNVTATNAPGDQPVCAANSPLSAEVYGRRTSCAVEGTAHITVRSDDDSDSEDSHATGIVQFVGDPCAGRSCAVGMEYRLDFANVEVGNFFESATFNKLAGMGDNRAGDQAMLSPNGDGTFGPQTLGASAQGRRDTDHLKGLVTSNGDPVDVNVGWGESLPTCSVHGTLLGNVDPEIKRCDGGPDAGKTCQSDADCTPDPGCTDGVCKCVAAGRADVTMSLDVTGTIFNQPPTANAGPDQNVECTAAAVNDVVLDASRSSDPDSNIALYSWLRGNRAGNEVGFDEMSSVEQPLGSQAYVLRVIDALGQADEDTTVVNVVDTTPPLLSCAAGRPVLHQTNHDLVNVGLMAVAQDQCEGTLPVRVNVFGDENDEGQTGDGHFSPDAKDIAVGTLRLRAERKGNSDGRVYLIITEATDSSGNRGFDCCTVAVPRSSAQAALRSVLNQAAAAKAFCLHNDGTPPPGYFVIGDGPVLGPKQ